MSYYSSDDDIDIRVEQRRSPPRQYVAAQVYDRPRPRPRQYYARDASPGYTESERTIISARSVSRDRVHRRWASPPPAAPVVINNRIYHEHSSDDDDRRHLQLTRRPRSRSGSRSSSRVMTREEYEIDRARSELAKMKMKNELEARERRTAKDLLEEAELRRAKEEIEAFKRRQAQEEDEKRIKKELEFKRLKEEEREAEEEKRREKEAEEAVERYKQKELERVQKERKEKERQERELQRRMEDHLFHAGLDEEQVEAIMNKQKIPEPKEDKSKATYTRMARKHLSFETLRTFEIEYTVDAKNPDYVLIKRWVPEWEQDMFWKHTKAVREKRSKLILSVDDRKHHHHHHHHDDDELHRDSKYEWVRRKSTSRRRSKSPSLLMYLAGVKPA